MKQFCIICLLVVFALSCGDEEDNTSIVGDWNIKTFEYKVTENGKVLTDQKWIDIGGLNFKNDGTGNIALVRAITGLPKETTLQWAIDSTNVILVRFDDGRATQRYAPSYRGMFTYLVSTGSSFTGTTFQQIERELVLQKK
jgi:hypothetical protein